MSTAFEKLTPREREVLRLVAAHLQSKEIARELGLSPKTVEMHVLSARRRLAGMSRRDAALAFVAWEDDDPGSDYRKHPGDLASAPPSPSLGPEIGDGDARTMPFPALRLSDLDAGRIKSLEPPLSTGGGRPTGSSWRDKLSNAAWLGLILIITVFTAALLAMAAISVHAFMLAIQRITGR